MSRVVRGVGKLVKGVVNGVKKFAKSKLGKIIIAAALVYFGGAALSGGFSSVGAGGTFMQGASAGLSSAASGITNAWTSLAAGEFGSAGSALAGGFTEAGAAGAAAGTNAGMNAAMLDLAASQGITAGAAAEGATAGVGAVATEGATSGLTTPTLASNTADVAANAIDPRFTGQTSTGLATVPGDAANVAGSQKGLLSRAADWYGGLKPSQQVMVSQVGGGLLSTGLRTVGAYKMAQEQRQMAADERARYNANIGGYRYGG